MFNDTAEEEAKQVNDSLCLENQLGAFINQVNALSGKKIDPLDADALILQAQAVIDLVCPLPFSSDQHLFTRPA